MWKLFKPKLGTFWSELRRALRNEWIDNSLPDSRDDSRCYRAVSSLYFLERSCWFSEFNSLITYPTEFVKTRSQFSAGPSSGSVTQKQTPIQIIKLTLREKGVWGLYSGCGALVYGNAIKAGVRFFTYDSLKGLLADKEVSIHIMQRG